jgi:hypothetical protein
VKFVLDSTLGKGWALLVGGLASTVVVTTGEACIWALPTLSIAETVKL